MTLKEYREAVGMTQQQLATALVISLRSVAKWESMGKRLEDIHPFFTRELLKIKSRQDRIKETK